MSALSGKAASDIKQLRDKITEIVQALIDLDQPTTHWDML